MGADPAMGEYLPSRGQQPSDLPAGGVFSSVNLNPYHYGGNNPLKYVDPTGAILMPVSSFYKQQGAYLFGKEVNHLYQYGSDQVGTGDVDNYGTSIAGCGCVLTAVTRIANAINNEAGQFGSYHPGEANAVASALGLYSPNNKNGNLNLLYPQEAAALISELTGMDISVNSFEGTHAELMKMISDLDADEGEYYVTGRLNSGHTVNIGNSASALSTVFGGDQPVDDTSTRGRNGTADYDERLIRIDVYSIEGTD